MRDGLMAIDDEEEFFVKFDQLLYYINNQVHPILQEEYLLCANSIKSICEEKWVCRSQSFAGEISDRDVIMEEDSRPLC